MIVRLAFALAVLVLPGLAAANEAVLVATSETVFGQPGGLVLSPDGRLLLAADAGDDRIKVLDAGSLKLIGAIGVGDLRTPRDLAFDPAGRLVVADTGNDRLAVFQLNGTGGRLLETWVDADLKNPSGIAAASQGRVFSTSMAGGGLLSFENGKLATRLGLQGSGPSEFLSPGGIAIDGTGRLFIADAGNSRIHVRDLRLRLVRMLTAERYGFTGPRELAFTADGGLLIVDEMNHQVIILGPDLQRVGSIGSGQPGNRAGQLDHPAGVESRNGLIWIADSGNRRVLLYRWGQGR